MRVGEILAAVHDTWEFAFVYLLHVPKTCVGKETEGVLRGAILLAFSFLGLAL